MDIKVLDPTGIYWRFKKSSIKLRIFDILRKSAKMFGLDPTGVYWFLEDFNFWRKYNNCDYQDVCPRPDWCLLIWDLSQKSWVAFLEFLHLSSSSSKCSGSILRECTEERYSWRINCVKKTKCFKMFGLDPTGVYWKKLF